MKLAKPAKPDRLAWAILLLAGLAVVVPFWPGRIDIDTQGELAEVASWHYTNRSCPILHALWSPFWHVGFGPWAVLLAQVAAFLVGGYLVLRAVFRPRGAALVMLAIALSPQVYGSLATISRDTWFIALLLATAGLTVRASQRPWPQRGRYLALALVAAWLTLAARQNAAAALGVILVVVAGLLLARGRESRGRPEPALRRAVGLAIAGGAALTLLFMGSQVAVLHVMSVEDQNPDAPLYIYDLAAISERQGVNLFPPELMRTRGMRPIDAGYDVDSMLNFVLPYFDPILVPFARRVNFPAVGSDASQALSSSWRSALGDHPGSYLGERATLWVRQIGITRGALSVYPPDAEDNGGYPFPFGGLARRATDYLNLLTSPDPGFYDQAKGNLLFAPFIFLAFALAGAIVLLRPSRELPLVIAGALALGALTYQVGLYFVALGTRYRFEYPCVVIGMVALAILLRLAWARRRAATPAAQAPASPSRRPL